MDYIATVRYEDGELGSFIFENENGYDLDINDVVDSIEQQVDDPCEITAITTYRSKFQ